MFTLMKKSREYYSDFKMFLRVSQFEVSLKPLLDCFCNLLLRNGALHLECLPFGNYLHDLLLVQRAICYKILIDGFCKHVE